MVCNDYIHFTRTVFIQILSKTLAYPSLLSQQKMEAQQQAVSDTCSIIHSACVLFELPYYSTERAGAMKQLYDAIVNTLNQHQARVQFDWYSLVNAWAPPYGVFYEGDHATAVSVYKEHEQTIVDLLTRAQEAFYDERRALIAAAEAQEYDSADEMQKDAPPNVGEPLKSDDQPHVHLYGPGAQSLGQTMNWVYYMKGQKYVI